MSVGTYAGNGQQKRTAEVSPTLKCSILLYHSDERRITELHRLITKVVRTTPVIQCLTTGELSSCCEGQDGFIVVCELSSETLPFLCEPHPNAQTIAWDEGDNTDPVILAQVLLAGVRLVIRHDTTSLQKAIEDLLQEAYDRPVYERGLWELGERHKLLGRSPALLGVLEQISSASQKRDIPVLLYGESGTGKELVARAIHRENQQFGRGPFMAVNCATMRGDLVRSELFGSKKGSFTGSVSDREGHFKAAQGGTIFLDEVQALDLISQAMLLRTIQEKKVLPVGSSDEVKIENVRITAATNERLESLIQIGNFRADLYFRLNALQIELPALRNRAEDIPLLARAFLQRYCSQHNSPDLRFAPEVLEAFSILPWRGNVRELENAVVRALISKRGNSDILKLGDLGSATLTAISQVGLVQHQQQNPQRFQMSEVTTLAEAIKALESWLIPRVLRETGGNQSKAAKVLDITRGSLRNKMREQGTKVSFLVQEEG